jgi:hypothetical protein
MGSIDEIPSGAATDLSRSGPRGVDRPLRKGPVGGDRHHAIDEVDNGADVVRDHRDNLPELRPAVSPGGTATTP